MKSLKPLFFGVLAICLMLSLNSCDIFQPEPDLSHLITNEEATELRQVYLEHQWEYINKGLEVNFENPNLDYTHFSIPIKQMKDYIRYVEQQAEEHNYHHLGLRFYLGARRDSVTNIPYSEMFYGAIAVPDSVNTDQPIYFETLPKFPHAMEADRVGCGGSNGGNGNNSGSGSN